MMPLLLLLHGSTIFVPPTAGAGTGVPHLRMTERNRVTLVMTRRDPRVEEED
jgi:hypothetical protein